METGATEVPISALFPVQHIGLNGTIGATGGTAFFVLHSQVAFCTRAAIYEGGRAAQFANLRYHTGLIHFIHYLMEISVFMVSEGYV